MKKIISYSYDHYPGVMSGLFNRPGINIMVAVPIIKRMNLLHRLRGRKEQCPKMES